MNRDINRVSMWCNLWGMKLNASKTKTMIVHCLCRMYRRVLLVVLWLLDHRHSFAPPHCGTSQYRRTSVPLSVSLWNDLSDPVFDGVGRAGFKSRANALLLFYLFLPSMGWLCGVGGFGLIECFTLSGLAQRTPI